MDLKKPTVQGMAMMDYLGHFKQDKYIEEGHNRTGHKIELMKEARVQKMAQAKENGHEHNEESVPKDGEGSGQGYADMSKNAPNGY